jgi:TonB family protein
MQRILQVLLAAALVGTLAEQGTAQAVDDQAVTPPRLENPDAIAERLQAVYPERLSRVGIGGVARVRVYVGEEGRADSIQVASSTGLDWLDMAAASAAALGTFEPARGPDGPRAMQLELPFQFGERERVLERELSVLNREAAVRYGEGRYPADLRRTGVGARVAVAFIVDGTGQVLEREVIEPGCIESAERTAADMAARLAFEARTGDPNDRFLSIATVTFVGDSITVLMRGDPGDVDVIPSEGPLDCVHRSPELLNDRQVTRALRYHYPSELHNRGVGGTAAVRLRIQPDGTVRDRLVTGSSGICEIDMAALEVARIMRFSPALRDGAPAAVWADMPIAFEVW